MSVGSTEHPVSIYIYSSLIITERATEWHAELWRPSCRRESQAWSRT